MKRNYINKLGMVLITLILGACAKVENGYISDYITYNLRTLEAVQGQVNYTGALVLDGSTGPVKVKLLSIRDKQTGREATEFLEEYDVPTYLAEITSEDNTLERLNQKIAIDQVPAIMVNEIGGRVGLTRATTNIETGIYTIDVEVTNNRGTKIINNALDIKLVPATTHTIDYQAMTTSDFGLEDNFIDAAQHFEIEVTREATDDNKIVFRWVDKNGDTFNPSAGEIIKRGDRPTFAHWSPYFEEEITDDAISYEFPLTGLDYPVLRQVNVAGSTWADGITYYRVVGSATDIGRNVNPVSTLRYHLGGTYHVTYHLKNVVRKS
ncbi:DUF5007 domain-containing protein [Sphingobacterium alkalisoli]|uniref:DUF5007 domain-containing protein n=1 Tax=Sphingobacterium alkalisoli TaxID=1874115 RepID=A0A4U0GWL1_9SPHI|nr:DUF5007 domain-containing protein [Sphingobacterium alkalisoli]TJY63521.1 DUF5007 domain-containing protein [Sphingobacterium alkalisoli]GGH26603.1 hypothetical protein GCM10011418_35960 [Sphingobacterium alkalisoli]